METKIQFLLNNNIVEFKPVSPSTLLSVLRTHFNLTGTKYGCGEGICGSCTVLIDKVPVRSCQVSIEEVRDKVVTTIEGLGQNGALHPLQQAFIEHDALQCGYCTPGMLMTAAGLLEKNEAPSKSEIILEMDDNLCRCGCYKRIVAAIQAAAIEMKKDH